MPVYNGEKYLSQAIESILNQTFSDFEFLIINDGSTDKTLHILQSYDDSRIKIITNKNNSGIVVSLNNGIMVSQGKYIARMDADDLSLPDRLEEQYTYLEKNPGLAMCGTYAIAIDEQKQEVNRYTYPPLDNTAIGKFSLLHNPFIHPTVMIRKNVLLEVGGYQQFFQHIEDYELWTRILQKYPAANLDRFLLEYRLNQDGITRKKKLLMRTKGLLVRFLAFWRIIMTHT